MRHLGVSVQVVDLWRVVPLCVGLEGSRQLNLHFFLRILLNHDVQSLVVVVFASEVGIKWLHQSSVRIAVLLLTDILCQTVVLAILLVKPDLP